MEMDCIPAGMELFPAADDEQFQFIKRVIDDCDYYILIIGGRYGSINASGVSYTEMEFDYAISRGLKVLAFVHGAPDDLPLKKSDIDPGLREKLVAFRQRVCSDRLVKFWTSPSELPGLVALSLSKTIKIYPAVGWVRASNVGNPELLADLNSLRKENTSLRERVSELDAKPSTGNLNIAGLDELFSVKFGWSYFEKGITRKSMEEITLSWGEIFAALAPMLQEHPTDQRVQSKLGGILFRKKKGKDNSHPTKVDDDDFMTTRVQLVALDLVAARYTQTVQGGMGFFWSLTPRGYRLMIELRTVKTKN